VAIDNKALSLPLRRSLPLAGKMGATGLELEATGDLSPAQLSQTGRRELRHLFTSHQLDIAALSCPLRHGLESPENQDARIDRLRQAMTMAFELGSRLVVVQPGPLVLDPKDPRYPALAEALTALGQHGDRCGSRLALETGFDAPEAVAGLLARFDTGGLAVAFEPGNLMVHNHDPYEGVRQLRSQLAYVRASDARRAGAGRLARRVPIGHGDLDWLQLTAHFEEIEYRGWLTVEADPGPNAAAELSAGVAFLKRIS
jgi:sugar phosphate isomerase/epimerase